MSGLLQDIRFAVRVLARSPVSTAAAVAALALAIGLNTAIYSVVRRTLIRPLPFPRSERIVDVGLVTASTRQVGRPGQMPSYGVYELWRQQSTGFEGLAAYDLAHPVLTDDGVPERIGVAGVESRLLTLIGARPALGRLFSPDEDIATGSPPAILSDTFWARHFGRDPRVIGRVVTLDGRPHHIVGVMPREFRFPVLPPGEGAADVQVWTPLASLRPNVSATRLNKAVVWVIGRLRHGMSPGVAAAELDRISERAGVFAADDPWRFAQVTSLQDLVVGSARGPLLLMLGATAFVLLVACASTADLLLARGLARQEEFMLRTALGAGRARLARQVVTESVALALVSGVVGVLLATLSVPLLVHLAGHELPVVGRVAVDGWVMSAALAATGVTAMLFGLLPALRAGRAPSIGLHGGSARTGRSRSRGRLTDGLVVAQVALTMILLSGAGILMRSFVRLVRVDLGFTPDRVLVTELDLPSDRYPSPAHQIAFAEAVQHLVRSVDGISRVAVSTSSPVAGGSFSVVNAPGTRTRLGTQPAWLVAATPDYFRVLGIPFVRGQSLDPAAPQEVLVDEAAEREFFSGVDPLGKSLAWRLDRSQGRVVGIVRSVRQDSPEKGPRPHIYIPLSAGIGRRLQVLARADGDPRRYVGAVRRAITEIDPDLPVDRMATMGDLIADSLARQRFYALLLGAFASCALLIAAGGIYATAYYAAAGAARELGIRAALGAPRSHLFALVTGRGLLLTAIGAAIGLGGAVAATRLLKGLLFQVGPADPVTFTLAFALLCLVALAASYLPGRRARRASPMLALRAE